jgi:CheY-like chemotaxis protein
VEQCRPSLIVMDYKLPKENGIECVQQLKTHPQFCMIPVIMWSTSGIYSQVKAAYKAGVQAYFEKPWSLNALVEKLQGLALLLKPDPSAVTSPD